MVEGQLDEVRRVGYPGYWIGQDAGNGVADREMARWSLLSDHGEGSFSNSRTSSEGMLKNSALRLWRKKLL